MGYYDFPHTRNYDTDLGYLIDWFKKNKNKIEENTAITIKKALSASEDAIKAYNSAINASNSATNASNSAELSLVLKNQIEALKNLMQDKIDQIDTNTNRINNLATINPGSITSTADAELVDIRVGDNGITYPSAGDSVRGQISELKSDLTQFGTRLSESITGISKTYELHTTFERGIIGTDGTMTDSTTRIRTLDFIPIMDTDVLIPNGYLVSFRFYKEKKIVDSDYAWREISKINIRNLIDKDFDSIKICLRKSDDGTFSDADVEFVNSNTIVSNKGVFDELDKKANKTYVNEKITSIEESVFDPNGTKEYTEVGTTVSGKQIQIYNNTINFANANDNYKYALYEIADGVNRLRITCQAGTNESYQVGYAFAGNNNNVLAIYNNTTGVYTVEADVPQGAKRVYVNNNGHIGLNPKIEKITFKKVIKGRNQFCDLSLFNHFGVIGDSYASGELYFNNEYVDKYEISWGQIMARKHGTICTNYSRGGLSTRTWLTDIHGLPKLSESEAEDIYYLALGINDYNGLGISYLGSLSDIESKADTFYGNYARIVEAVKNHAPNAKIVMFTCASTNEIPQQFNEAIINIAKHYNIPYIVLAEDEFFQSYTYTNMAGGHPRAIAYSGMAMAFERLLNKCMIDNSVYFDDAFMY